MITGFLRASLVWLALLFFTSNVFALEQAGHIQAVRGKVVAHTEGWEPRILKKDATVYSGDRIVTAKKSAVYIKFLDDTFFVLGSSSEMVIDNFSLKQDEESFTSRILKGTFRFLSGVLARKKPSSVQVGTVVATIGIRGTHVAGEVMERRIENGEIVEASAKITLLEPEQKGEKSAIEVSNEFGSVIVDEPGYGTEIPDEHSPPGPVRKMQLRSINNIMRALRSATQGTKVPKIKVR